MEWYWYVIGAIIFLAFGVGFYLNKKKQQADDFPVQPFPINDFPTSWPFSTTTPKGALVYSTVLVPATALEIIDAGLVQQIQRMPIGWLRARTPADYTIRFVNPDTLNIDGSPALFVRVTSTESIQSAGTVLGYGWMKGNPPLCICLPHQEQGGWQFKDYLFNSVWYEGEHFSEYENDLTEFGKWAKVGDVHPHRP